jgi:hypothetical protein
MRRRLASPAAMAAVILGSVNMPFGTLLPIAGFSLDGDSPVCDMNQVETCLNVAKQALEDCEECRTTSGAPSALDTCQKGQCRSDYELQHGACYNLYCPGKPKP